MNKLGKLLAITSLAISHLSAIEIRKPNDYFQSVQYNWSGEYDIEGKKIPGETPECIAKGLYHPQDTDVPHKDPFSIINFNVIAGAHLNPVRFKTIHNIVYITSGTGVLKLYDETGSQVIEEHAVEPEYTIHIPAMTRYSFVSSIEADLKGVIFSSPAWFMEDEEYDWDLVKMIFPNK